METQQLQHLCRFVEVKLYIQIGLNKLKHTQDLKKIIEALLSNGWIIFFLRGKIIFDRNSFFNAIKATLPLDPPIVGSHSWDALSDSIWGGIDSIVENKIVIIWENTEVMQIHANEDYNIAIELLDDIAKSLNNDKATDGETKQVGIIIYNGIAEV